MSKVLRPALIILLVICGLIVFSPFISLLLPRKLTNRTYYRLMYNIIADRETAGLSGENEKAVKLFDYVVNREFGQGLPRKCKPAESLIYAEAYCDFQARTLNALLAAAGINSRYCMLLDKNGDSFHTLNEVFLGGKWAVFDTLTNIIFSDSKGRPLSLEELSGRLGLISENEKMTALKEYDKEGFLNLVSFYSRGLPIPILPRKSKPLSGQEHIFDRTADLYYRAFGKEFFNFYQDLYLRLKTGSFKEEERVFFKARNYHLAYRYKLALKYYSMLENLYPQGARMQDAPFFLGMLYFEQGDFSRAAASFNLTLQKYPQKWGAPAVYYLGRVYACLNDKEASRKAYAKCPTQRLSAEVLRRLAE